MEEDERIAVSSESSGRSDEPIIALRNVEPVQVRTSERGFENDMIYCCGQFAIILPIQMKLIIILQESYEATSVERGLMMVPGTIMHVDRYVCNFMLQQM